MRRSHRLVLSICIHRTPSKSWNLNEISQICEKFGTISSTSQQALFLFINFRYINDLDGCIQKLRKAGYSAEESRKNQRRRERLGITEQPVNQNNSSYSSEAEEGSQSDSGQEEGYNTSFSNAAESSGQCKNPTCKKITSFVCGRCCDFFCSQECLQGEWETHRYICFPIPKVIPIKNYGQGNTKIPSSPANVKRGTAPDEKESLSRTVEKEMRFLSMTGRAPMKNEISKMTTKSSRLPEEFSSAFNLSSENATEIFNKYYGHSGGKNFAH